MKGKKEYLILAFIIAASAAYLIFNKTDRIHYTLPVLNKVQANEISRISIVRPGGSTVLDRKGQAFYIADHSWRANPEKVSEMLTALSGLKVTDMVSEAGTYERYQLDKKDAVMIKAFSGKDLKRELAVGKAAPTDRHTYIKLPGDRRVYLAEGELARIFNAPVSELRDMVVLSITPMDITRIEADQEGQTIALTREAILPDKSQGKAIKDKARQFIWKDEKGAVKDKAAIDTLLAALSKVYCEAYLEDAMKASLIDPVISLRLWGQKEYSLSVFDKSGEKIPALSSESESPFVLPGYKYDALKDALKEIKKK